MKLRSYMRPYLPFAILSPLLMIAEVTADLCLPFLMSWIVDFGIVGKDIAATPLAAWLMSALCGPGYTPFQIIVTFGLLMLGITLVGGFFGVACAYTAARASQGFGHDLRRDAYRHVMSLSAEQTDRFTTGSLVTRMTSDVAMVVEFSEQLLRMFVRSPMFLVGGTVALVLLNVNFGFVILCALPLLLLTLFLVLRRAVPLYGTVQTRLDRVNAVVQENVGGARVVKAYSREEYEEARFGAANTALRDVNWRVGRLMAITHPVLMTLMNAAIIAILYLGGISVADGALGMTTGTIMAGITYVTQVMNSVMMVAMMFNSISRAAASSRRIREVLAATPVIRGGSVTAGHGDVAVSLRAVDFVYPGTEKPVLCDVTLDVRRGEVLAIVGETGCGKTSLLNLIPRFYDATGGEVLVEGVPVREWDIDALRARIGYVMQKSQLFSGTLADNIRWGDPDADDAAVAAAARVAQAEEYISSFAEGYATPVAEKGASLSGGQKQRLSIARAVARRPAILLLDDATSALDLVTEARLRAALDAEMQGTTVIMVAQRIASVRGADRIAVLEADGRILHCAPHDRLMEISQTYREIYASQNKKEGA